MTDTSKPAFPTAWQQEWPGLTLREYAAVHALAGLMAYPYTGNVTPSMHAIDAVAAADALIAELEKGE